MDQPTVQLLSLLGVDNILVFVLALTRVTPLFIIAPVFSSRQIPTQAKVVIAVALAIGLTPSAVPPDSIDGDSLVGLLGMLGVELLVGFAIAYALVAVTAALEVAGTLLDFGVGFSFGAQIDPVSGNQNAVLARLYGLMGVMIFLTIGGDEWVIRGVARSYELVPIGSTPDIVRLVAGADRTFAAIFGSALQIAAPVMLALVLADVGFGLLTRVVPQLNVFAVGLPIKVIVGMLLIGISLPLVGTWVERELERSVGAALQSLRVG
ncbi:MAG: flagellar biosynthetic protein FliR [Solirubrobacteraceae bacterium]|nr:flagellar biosynthetic protein FliR [Solirubrobacteraceae bacterium]